jgi:hypothetical protein
MPKVKISGTKKDGYVIVINGDNHSWDLPIFDDELQTLYKLLKKKYN